MHGETVKFTSYDIYHMPVEHMAPLSSNFIPYSFKFKTVGKSKRFWQRYLNNKHDYLLDCIIVVSSLKHKVLETGKQILLWGI